MTHKEVIEKWGPLSPDKQAEMLADLASHIFQMPTEKEIREMINGLIEMAQNEMAEESEDDDFDERAIELVRTWLRTRVSGIVENEVKPTIPKCTQSAGFTGIDYCYSNDMPNPKKGIEPIICNGLKPDCECYESPNKTK